MPFAVTIVATNWCRAISPCSSTPVISRPKARSRWDAGCRRPLPESMQGQPMFRTDPRRRKKHGLRRLVLFLTAFALTVLLLAHVDSKAASRAVSTPAKLAGAFVNWGPIGREHTLQAWEKWLKQKPSSVLGVDFYGQTA